LLPFIAKSEEDKPLYQQIARLQTINVIMLKSNNDLNITFPNIIHHNDTTQNNQNNDIQEAEYCAINEYIQRIDNEEKEEKNVKGESVATEESIFDRAYRLQKSNKQKSFITLADLSQNTHIQTLPQQTLPQQPAPIQQTINNASHGNKLTCWYITKTKFKSIYEEIIYP
jgi:hypothetical protein